MKKYNEKELDRILICIRIRKRNILNLRENDESFLDMFLADLKRYEEELEEVCPNYKHARQIVDKIISEYKGEHYEMVAKPKDMESVRFLLRYEGYSRNEYTEVAPPEDDDDPYYVIWLN